jgi:hypothetical protein
VVVEVIGFTVKKQLNNYVSILLFEFVLDFGFIPPAKVVRRTGI